MLHLQMRRQFGSSKGAKQPRVFFASESLGNGGPVHAADVCGTTDFIDLFNLLLDHHLLQMERVAARAAYRRQIPASVPEGKRPGRGYGGERTVPPLAAG